MLRHRNPRPHSVRSRASGHYDCSDCAVVMTRPSVEGGLEAWHRPRKDPQARREGQGSDSRLSGVLFSACSLPGR